MFKTLIALFGALTLTAALASGSYAAELEKVRCSEAVRGFFFLPLYVAHGLKLFEKQNLAVEIDSTQGGPLAIQALLAGDVQFCAAGHGQVANVYSQGKSTKIVNLMQDKCTFYLVARPEIESIAALKGKTVGCSKIGAETDAVGRALVAKAGLDPQKDIDMQGVGGMGTMAGALENNRVQAVMAWQPLTNMLVNSGKGKLLARLNTAADSKKHFGSPDYSFSILQVTDAFIKERPETVQRFVNALVEAEKWLLAHSSEETAKVVVPYFQGMDEKTIADAVTADREAFTSTGVVSKEGHETAVRVFTEAQILTKPVPFEAIVDNSFSQKAWK